MRADELKSTSITSKPQFVIDLARYIETNNLPAFIEVVDKRFFICANLVSSFLIPPVGDFDLAVDVIKMKNFFAEYLYARMPLNILQTFVDACALPSIENTRKAFLAIVGWLDSIKRADSIAAGLHLFAADSQKDFEVLAHREPDSRRFLPIPDDSKKGKPLWMLPNLTSFTNIYGRINLYRERKLDGVRLVHDEQLQFDQILADGKLALEGFKELGRAWPVPFTDYIFAEAAHLSFETSSRGVGIQMADVLAGFVMRYVQDVGLRQEALPPDYGRAFEAILAFSNPQLGTGINFVLPTEMLPRLGVEAARFG